MNITRHSITAPNGMSPEVKVFGENRRGANFSVAGEFTGNLILEGHYGDGVWNTFKVYTGNAEDFGNITAPAVTFRFKGADDFAGEAKVLIVQEGW